MTFDSLMSELGEALGAAHGIPRTEDGVYSIGMDRQQISFMEIPERKELLFWCYLGEVPPEGKAKMNAAMLTANFMGQGTRGAVLSLSKDEQIVLHRQLPLADLDCQSLLAALEDFVIICVDWANMIDGYSQKVMQPESSAESEDVGLVLGGFIQV